MGEENFHFLVLFIGNEWIEKKTRENKETELIQKNPSICYNFLDSPSRPLEKNPFFQKTQTKQAKKKIGDAMRNVPKDALGRKIIINGITYPSITKASRQTGHSRKLIRFRVNSPDYVNWYSI